MPRLSDEAVRAMHLLALDATALVRRIESRHEQMVAGFSRLRDRDALLGALHAFGLTARFQDFSALPIAVQDAALRFYELADDLRWYCKFTQDMPGALSLRLEAFRRELAQAHAALARVLEASTSRARRRRPAARPARAKARG